MQFVRVLSKRDKAPASLMICIYRYRVLLLVLLTLPGSIGLTNLVPRPPAQILSHSSELFYDCEMKSGREAWVRG